MQRVQEAGATGKAIGPPLEANQPTLIEQTNERPAPAAGDGLALVIERLAENGSVDVDKLERIIQLQERILKHHAEVAFNAAFAQMQPKIPVIIERKQGDGNKWRYAPLEDIVEPLRPIMAEFGFSLSHQTEWPDAKTVKVIGILTHREGHSRRSEFQSAADQSGSKNSIQALGSSVSYGKRYTTNDLLCIVTRGQDDNGRDSDKAQAPDPPEGFETFWASVKAAAAKGIKAFDPAWECGEADFKNYAVKHLRDELNQLKRTARDVKAAR